MKTMHSTALSWDRIAKEHAIALAPDLMRLSQAQTWMELTIALPWLILEIVLLSWGYSLWALPCAFYLFLTGLRQVHGGYHLSIGLSRAWTDRFLALMSLIMLGSMHAVKFNHLMHHRYNLSESDIEAKSAHMHWWQAILFGPKFPWLLHYHAWIRGNTHYRRWILIELGGNAFILLLSAVLAFSAITWVPLMHYALMGLGQCLTAFFAVWTVHHNCEPEGVFARTQKGRFKNFISYNMFFHIEHHLCPKVPQRHLPQLAEQLNRVEPHLRSKMVF